MNPRERACVAACLGAFALTGAWSGFGRCNLRGPMPFRAVSGRLGCAITPLGTSFVPK